MVGEAEAEAAAAAAAVTRTSETDGSGYGSHFEFCDGAIKVVKAVPDVFVLPSAGHEFEALKDIDHVVDAPAPHAWEVSRHTDTHRHRHTDTHNVRHSEVTMAAECARKTPLNSLTLKQRNATGCQGDAHTDTDTDTDTHTRTTLPLQTPNAPREAATSSSASTAPSCPAQMSQNLSKEQGARGNRL